MAATVVSFPPDPASVYRPMPLHVDRTDPSGSAIAWIKVADATDVSTYGNGLQVGQVFIQHATIHGSVPMQAGQTLHIYQNGGPYLGVWKCINSWGSSTVYTIIDAPAMGDFTPSGSPTSALRVYLDNYAILTKVLIYTDPTGTPQQVVLRAQPSDAAGNAIINVDVVLRDYFNYRIESFIKPMPGVPVQSAHGITAIFYRLHVVEVYDSPDVDMGDPFDGTHDVHVDSTASPSTFRVAVNAVHPYAAKNINWGAADLAPYRLVGGYTQNKVLTMAPRGNVMTDMGAVPGTKMMATPVDTMWMTMLTTAANGWAVPGQIFMVVYDVDAHAYITSVPVALAGPYAAFSVGFGPQNIYPYVANVRRYSVWLNNEAAESGAARITEPIEVTIDAACKENRRPFAWLNKLGGIDAHTFTGREIYSTKVKRATVRKPYGAGTGYDWTERTYRAEPERTRTISTKPLPVEYRRWLSEDMAESANVLAMVEGMACPVVLLTDEAQGGSTMPVSSKPFTVEYRLGVDNLSQQA